MEEQMEPFSSHPITIDDAKPIIEGCRSCAAGPRVCHSRFFRVSCIGSVFTNEIAGRLGEVGKARFPSTF